MLLACVKKPQMVKSNLKSSTFLTLELVPSVIAAWQWHSVNFLCYAQNSAPAKQIQFYECLTAISVFFFLPKVECPRNAFWTLETKALTTFVKVEISKLLCFEELLLVQFGNC